jgi:hypothetical protein
MKHLSFDTSAISGHRGLARHHDRRALLAGISSGYFTRLTFPSVEEPMATPDAIERDDLFEVLAKLLRNGECLQPHNWLAERFIQNYERHGSSRWDSFNISFRECENAIARREFSQAESDRQREFAAQARAQFNAVFADPRPEFDKLFASGVERPATAEELLAHLNGDGGAFWNFGSGLYECAAGRRPTEQQIRTFVDDCPPFFCLLLGLVHAQFEWTIRGTQIKAKKRVSRIDLFSAIYLPYCDTYVTDDSEQHRCLSEIKTTAKLPVEIVSFTDFSQRLMPFAHVTAGAS